MGLETPAASSITLATSASTLLFPPSQTWAPRSPSAGAPGPVCPVRQAALRRGPAALAAPHLGLRLHAPALHIRHGPSEHLEEGGTWGHLAVVAEAVEACLSSPWKRRLPKGRLRSQNSKVHNSRPLCSRGAPESPAALGLHGLAPQHRQETARESMPPIRCPLRA